MIGREETTERTGPDRACTAFAFGWGELQHYLKQALFWGNVSHDIERYFVALGGDTFELDALGSVEVWAQWRMNSTTILALAALAGLGGCANYRDSPHYAQCVAESKTPVPPWYSIGTVQAEMLRMCVEAKEQAAK